MCQDVIDAVRRSAARAAVNPAIWPETMVRLGRMLGSDMTLFETFDKRTGTNRIGFTDRPDIIADTRDAYEQYYYRTNVRWNLTRQLPTGAIFGDDQIGDDRALDRLEFYVDFLAPSKIKYFLGATLVDDAHCRIALSTNRAPDRGRPGADEAARLAAVLPDLSNAVSLYLRMLRAGGGGPLVEVLDRLADPVAIVAADGRLRYRNQAMSGLLDLGDLFVEKDARLAGARRDLHQALSAALHQATRGVSGAASAWTEAGRLILRAVALDARHSGDLPEAGDGPWLCVLIDDPAQPHWRQVEQAMSLFGLTRREAQVGSHLAGGLSVDEIAARLALSRNTVRTHLTAAREKLGVRTAIAVAAQMRRAASTID